MREYTHSPRPGGERTCFRVTGVFASEEEASRRRRWRGQATTAEDCRSAHGAVGTKARVVIGAAHTGR